MSIPQSQGAGGENIHQQVAFITLALDKAVYPFNATALSQARRRIWFLSAQLCLRWCSSFFLSSPLRRDYHERQRRSGYFSGAPDARFRKLPRIVR